MRNAAKRRLRSVTVQVDPGTVNAVYRPLLDCKKRYLVLYGGAGSGKSYFLAQRYLLRLLSGGHNLLVVRKVARTNRDSTFALFRQVIAQWQLEEFFSVRESDCRIRCVLNGYSILFAGLDDVEKLKSVTCENGVLTDIWIEEASEIAESDFNQLDVRLRGGTAEKQICLSFNPISANHWLKRRFFDRQEENAAVLHTTYRDNAFLDEGYRALLESYRSSDPYYYDVYCLGQWGVFGKTVFDAHAVNRRLSELKEPLKRGRFAFSVRFDPQAQQQRIDDGAIRWEDAPDGEIAIYFPPEQNVPYVIGADTAGEGSDFFAAQVLDNRTGAQTAVLHSAFDEDVFAQQLYCLGQYYNRALVGIEANFSSYPIRELERLGYEHQAVRITEDNFTHAPKKSFGVRTTAQTRPVMLAGLVREVRERPELLADRATLLELLTFVRNERGRPEAQSGSHDDLVMALAIAHYIRPQQETEARAAPEERRLLPPELQTEPDTAGNGVMEW
ncbi:MAG: PBSX family phage terminase large subunit [Firmicutes bacterium]|nr:PBSX family phage terminase large subunit [Bacillota bacterium]